MMVFSINLGKDGKFLPEELVGEVHCSVQDACDIGLNMWERGILFAWNIVCQAHYQEDNSYSKSFSPAPCVRMLLAMCWMLIVFRCLLFEACSTNTWWWITLHDLIINHHQEKFLHFIYWLHCPQQWKFLYHPFSHLLFRDTSEFIFNINEHLSIDVVVVSSSEYVNVPHHLEHIQPLLKCLWRQPEHHYAIARPCHVRTYFGRLGCRT